MLLSDITNLSKNKNNTPKKPTITPSNLKIFYFSFEVKKCASKVPLKGVVLIRIADK